MSRAGPDTLLQLQPLLAALRKIPGLTETKPGIFYIKRLPMLHFHQTDAGVVADLKRVLPVPGGFDRFAAATAPAQRKLIAETALRCRQLQSEKRP